MAFHVTCLRSAAQMDLVLQPDSPPSPQGSALAPKQSSARRKRVHDPSQHQTPRSIRGPPEPRAVRWHSEAPHPPAQADSGAASGTLAPPSGVTTAFPAAPSPPSRQLRAEWPGCRGAAEDNVVQLAPIGCAECCWASAAAVWRGEEGARAIRVGNRELDVVCSCCAPGTTTSAGAGAAADASGAGGCAGSPIRAPQSPSRSLRRQLGC